MRMLLLVNMTVALCAALTCAVLAGPPSGTDGRAYSWQSAIGSSGSGNHGALSANRNVYGYIGFGYGVAPWVNCTVRLSGPGVNLSTRSYWHPFGTLMHRYYFNRVPTGRRYTVTVIPDALYQPKSVTFDLPTGWGDFKVPDVWVRP